MSNGELNNIKPFLVFNSYFYYLPTNMASAENGNYTINLKSVGSLFKIYDNYKQSFLNLKRNETRC